MLLSWKNSIAKSPLVQNIVSLGTLQFLNYIIPFITFPYVVRVLGPEKFGLVNFASAFVAYFNLITDYGFNLSATRDIAINKDDKVRISEIVCAVFLIKLILFFISLMIFSSVLISFEKFRSDPAIYLVNLTTLLGLTFTPVWFFLGVEKMKLITIPTLIVRSATTALVFLLIKSATDYIIYALLNGIGFILIGIIALIIMRFNIGIRFVVPELKEIRYQAKESGILFISTFSISLYTISNTFILGLFAPLNVVGYFAGADKIRAAVQNLLAPLTQAIYPHISRLFLESKPEALSYLRRVFRTAGLFSASCSLLLFLLAKPIVFLILGNRYYNSILVLRIIAFLPTIIFLSNLLGIQGMINLGFKKNFTRIIVLASVVNLILSFTLVPRYFEIGTAFAVLITELVVTSSMIVFMARRGMNFISFN